MGGEREEKCRAALDLAVGPDPSAVALDDAPRRREADAGAIENRRRVETREDAEEVLGVDGMEAGAIVAHEEYELVCEHQAADGDRRFVVATREFPGIVQKIFEQ